MIGAGTAINPLEVSTCIKRRRAGDGRATGRCEELGEKLAHSVQSDRSFALSYADSLAAQGGGADAGRVRACVERAAHGAAAMQRCSKHADDLLFG